MTEGVGFPPHCAAQEIQVKFTAKPPSHTVLEIDAKQERPSIDILGHKPKSIR